MDPQIVADDVHGFPLLLSLTGFNHSKAFHSLTEMIWRDMTLLTKGVPGRILRPGGLASPAGSCTTNDLDGEG
jgi:hypothetical protein